MGGVSDRIPVHTSFRNAEIIILNWFVTVGYLFIYFLMTTNSSFGSLTSSFMPVSSSIMTQASIGSAISLPLLFRCSSSPVPNAGFSVHESKNRGSRGSMGSQEKRGTVSATNLKIQNKCYLGLGGKKASMVWNHQVCCWSGWQISRSASLPQASVWCSLFKLMSNNNRVLAHVSSSVVTVHITRDQHVDI